MLIHRARGAAKDKKLEQRGDEIKGQGSESEVKEFTRGKVKKGR